jgi:urea transport system ATP-binding protein
MNGTALYQFTPPAEDELLAVSGTASMGRVMPAGIDTSHGTILYLEDIEVSFDGFRALNKLSLAIDAGELRCVIGPNGAGKTTMMDVITGKTRPDAGKVFLGQTIDLARMSEPEIARAGIGRKFQKPTVFEQHPVWENLELAMKTDKGWLASLRARLDRAAQAKIEDTLTLIGLESDAYRAAGELSHGQKQRLEIGMLLMQRRAAAARRARGRHDRPRDDGAREAAEQRCAAPAR